MSSLIQTSGRESYSAISVINHWITVLLVMAMLILGLLASAAPDSAEDFIMSVHVSLGFFVFWFVLWRAAYRVHQGFPPTQGQTPWQRQLAWWVHRLVLGLLVLQVFTGPLYLFTENEGVNVFGWFTVLIPLESLAFIHEPVEVLHVITGLYVLPALLLLHIVGAFHYFWQRRSVTPAELGE
ncbi:MULTISPECIES: cytochrome b [unclassified Marinimicrobium]|jgi:cytochrome b561|uniref:cytochrome b n=1 Tax=unclassified Marinimicrobium TaxID=2632100 RepID=UPI000C5AC514|nr:MULTISPECIES: cytochrome b/b6 domain-containing protein [unclassified Marinimicrobium]MAN51136.1 cytochrome B [Marinimicrobium sp.]|tara:strand:+ start:121 stop:666 length:546 start_codon:yes stop_codon:yes gene_type:complete